MRPRDRALARRLDAAIQAYDQQHPLPGIADVASRAAFIEQLLESIRRVSYVSAIRAREISPLRTDPRSALFDPIKAAVLHQRAGHGDEASWLVFLSVHFGRHARGGWTYPREVYGQLGGTDRWDWATVSADPTGFRDWLNAHQQELKGLIGGFGNHRKYESLDAYSSRGTGAAVESYVSWVGPPRTHSELFAQALDEANGDARKAFDDLYGSMDAVARFGRTARFDYLTMIGKVGLSTIEPGSTYMGGATGPRKGAQLLLGADDGVKVLDHRMVELGTVLHVGMQVLEDALCNWQKSPTEFMPFRG